LNRTISITTGFDHYRQLATREFLSFPGSLFYNPDFIEISAEILDLVPCPIAILENDQIVGLANFMLNDKFGIKTMTIPKFFQYYGPVFFKPDMDLFISVERYLEQTTDLAVFSILPEISGQITSAKWKYTDRLTYYLKPDIYENLRKNCLESVKNKLNKALKSEIIIGQSDEFPFEIYKETFKRHGLRPPIDEYRIKIWVKKLTAVGLAKTYRAYQSGKVLAFRTELTADGYAYDWLAGSLSEANSRGINQFLVLMIGQTLYEAKINNWDLLGGDIKSIGDFKRSFGSTPRHHLQIERAFSLKGRIYRSLMKLKGAGDA